MMTLVLIGVLAGVIAGVSPCVLPLLPVIFFAGGVGGKGAHEVGATGAATTVRGSRAGVADLCAAGPGPAGSAAAPSATHSLRRPLAIIGGLVLGFAFVALAGSLLLSALGLPQDVLRWAGVVVLTVIGLSLIVPRLEAFIQRPFARLPKVARRRGAEGNAFVLGLGLGTLYVPCAGPVLAAITIAGTSGRIDGRIVVLTAAFAAGTAVPLFFFAAAGNAIGRRISAYRRRAGAFRLTGAVVMIGLAGALTFGLTDGLQRDLPNYTAAAVDQVENNSAARSALAAVNAAPEVALTACPEGQATPANCGSAPAITGVSIWLNLDGGPPPVLDQLHGKVVLIDFWTYSCINCQHALPHVEAWNTAYAAAGLQVIGIHTPEFAFEKVPDNVRGEIADLAVTYPVALDNSASTWRNFHNSYWPALYLIDAKGIVRHVKFGEGGYAVTETLIRQLLQATNPSVALPAPVEG